MQLMKQGIIPVLILEDLNRILEKNDNHIVQTYIRTIGSDNNCGIVFASMSESATATSSKMVCCYNPC